MATAVQLRAYLDSVPAVDGIHQISPARAFQHDEELYDSQYDFQNLSPSELKRQVQNLMELCRRHGFVDGSPVLEIGCGSGKISTGLAMQPAVGALLVTDPSPAFCRLTKRKLAGAQLLPERVAIAGLRAEDVGLLPPGCVSLIVLRSVLHHVPDVESFLRGCASVLPPGGLLVCEEPYYEGYMMMGFAAQFIELALSASGYTCTPEDTDRIETFRATMQFYCRRDLDKREAEDKHLFRPDELQRAALAVALECEHYPNWRITFSPEQNATARNNYFLGFFSDYIRYCMHWPPAFADRVVAATSKYFDYFAPLEAAGNTVPWCYGTFVFTKR